MQIGSHISSQNKASFKSTPAKSAERIEAEVVDRFVQSAEQLSGASFGEQVASYAESGVSPITAAFIAIGGSLPPAQALALAGQSFAHTQPQVTNSVGSSFLEERKALDVLGNGVEVFSHKDIPAALTTGSTVYLNPMFEPHMGTALVDWIVGHELGHMQSEDGLAAIGRDFLLGQLRKDGLDEAIVSQLEAVHHQLNRACEFESDEEGLQYAMSRGHSKDAIINSAEAFLSAMPEGFDTTHPEPEERIAKLRSTAPRSK